MPRVSRSRWRWLEATAALLESLSGFALHFFRLLPTASPTSRFARVARAAYLRAEAEAVDRRARRTSGPSTPAATAVQIPLATEEEEEAVVAVKEKSVSSSPRHYSTDLQTLKSVVEGIQDVCRDAAARWALATADTATLRRRLLVPALRESRGIADHPLWAHTSEPLRPDLEELNERVEHALELGTPQASEGPRHRSPRRWRI